MLRYPYAVVRDLARGEINLRAMGLVYTTLLSLIPLLASAPSQAAAHADVASGCTATAGAVVAALKGVPADIRIADLYQLSTLLREACVTRRT